jgi:hypothetical protein
MKMVWLDLKHFCKTYERIKKNRKRKGEKEKRKRKKSKRLRGHDSAWDQKKPTAQQETIPNRYPSPSLISLTAWAHMSAPIPSSSRNPLLLSLWPVMPVITRSNLTI